jgi:hypothetical protein
MTDRTIVWEDEEVLPTGLVEFRLLSASGLLTRKQTSVTRHTRCRGVATYSDGHREPIEVNSVEYETPITVHSGRDSPHLAPATSGNDSWTTTCSA